MSKIKYFLMKIPLLSTVLFQINSLTNGCFSIMDTEAYYEGYVEIRSEQIAYINAYTREMIGAPNVENEDDLKEYN